MRTFFLSAIAIPLLLAPGIVFSQTPNLGASSTFALFTADGAFNGDPASSVVGDIGTNVGMFTPPGFHVGQVHVSDPTSVQAALDVASAYGYLASRTCGAVLTTPLGNGQILAPNIYCLGGASVLNADLILDGGGNPSAVFVFQLGGALSTNPASRILLINGASLCNVYWQINGAFNAGSNTLFQGTIIADGAINLGNGAVLSGRGLSTSGAISTSANSVQLPAACLCSLEVTCPPAFGGSFPCINAIPAGVASDVTVVSACGTAAVAITQTSSGAGCANSPYILVRTYTVTDGGGHTTTCEVTYNASDIITPIITCPTVPASVECPAVPTFPAAIATDACGGTPVITSADVTTPGNCPQRFTVTRTWTASDACGNASTCSRTIAVTDNTGPVITCPTVTASVECPAVPTFPAATAVDACDGIPVITSADVTTPGNCPQRFSVTRTWTATDACGNASTCSRTIAVTDNTGPVITCPTVTASVECPAVPTFPAATAVDACGSIPVITSADVTTPGNCPQRFSVTRTWTASDACGNTSTCSRTIAVTDNTGPVITCPTVTASVECPAVPTFPAATAVDACGSIPVITSADVTIPGNCLQRFTVTRTWTASDACGNTATCSRTIAVTDNTGPVITCPTVTASVECPAVPTFPAATAVDACDGIPVITSADVTTPGNCPQRFSVTRTWTASDACGNTSTCSRTIAVTDNTGPVITCPTVTASVECPAVPTFPAATAVDACGSIPVITSADVTTPGNCPQRFSVTRTWTASDACGNTSTCSRTIAVTDNTPPIFNNPPANFTMDCSLLPIIPFLPTATDICSGPALVILLSQNQAPGICPILYTVTRIWRATDNCGNSATVSQVITVIDTYAPQFTVDAMDVILDCNLATNEDAFQNWLNNHGGAVVTDCSTVTWTFMPSPFFTMPSTWHLPTVYPFYRDGRLWQRIFSGCHVYHHGYDAADLYRASDEFKRGVYGGFKWRIGTVRMAG